MWVCSVSRKNGTTAHYLRTRQDRLEVYANSGAHACSHCFVHEKHERHEKTCWHLGSRLERANFSDF
jgi:hypothetical protein